MDCTSSVHLDGSQVLQIRTASTMLVVNPLWTPPMENSTPPEINPRDFVQENLSQLPNESNSNKFYIHLLHGNKQYFFQGSGIGKIEDKQISADLLSKN